MGQGILLINLGTPSSYDYRGVVPYLRQFLTDKRVINLPVIFRWLLVCGFIIPIRSKKTVLAYQSIWTVDGSPLFSISRKQRDKLQQLLGSEYKVALGMRYGKPSIKDAIKELQSCDSICVLPLYPQYASATTGSSIEEVLQTYQSLEVIPNLTIIRDFYQHPAYLDAQAAQIKPYLQDSEFILFSYHGLPERQIIASGCSSVCKSTCPPPLEKNPGCYKAQCYHTTRLLAQSLGLHDQQFSTAFQSRLGKIPWIQPYTDTVLKELAAKGIKKLCIVCPSFVSDCLETIEEIGIRAQQQWLALGGNQLSLVPCMNSEDVWIQALAKITVKT